MARAPCVAHSSATLRIPLSEQLIQGLLPSPSELEVFLSDNGIYCRQIGEAEEATVGVGGEPAAPTPLFMF